MNADRGPGTEGIRSCTDRVPLGTRLWRAFVTRPRSLVLAIIGAGVFTTGIFLRQDGVGIGLVVLGVAVLSLGVMLPTVQEAQIGPGGFTLKTTVEMREAELRPFGEPELDARRGRLDDGIAGRAGPLQVGVGERRTWSG